jgi:hypothetical protein
MKKQSEFFRMYLLSNASYAPENSGVLKKGHPGCRVQKFSNLTQILFFWQALKNRHRTGTDLQRQLYLIKIVIPKFDPLTVTGMALSVDLGCSDRLTTV